MASEGNECSGNYKCPTFGLGIAATRDEFLSELNAQKSKMVDCAAYRGDQDENARLSVRDIHEYMKVNYTHMIDTVGNTNIYPLLVASDVDPGFEGVGSSFTLHRRDGSSKRILVCSRDYEFFKALSHMPLGLFTILSAYFNAPNSSGWVGRLQVYLTKVNDALHALDHTTEKFDEGLKEHAQAMLNLVKTFIETRVESKNITREQFEDFGKEIFPYVFRGLKAAAKLQAEANLPALRKLKEEMGPEEWRDMYVVIPTVWPVSSINPRQQILKALMDKDRHDSHIILTENSFTLEAARSCVGRVVADRAMAQLFFGVQDDLRKSLNFALSSKRDLLSDASQHAIEKVISSEEWNNPAAASPEKKPEEKQPGWKQILVEI